MSGAIPPLPQYTFMAWCLVKAQGQLYQFFWRQKFQCSVVQNTEQYCFEINVNDGLNLIQRTAHSCLSIT
jgi:hypothetical protein